MNAANAKDRLLTAMRSRSDLFVEDPEVAKLIQSLKPARARGHITRSELLKVCRFKSSRRIGECEKNSPAAVQQASRAAFSTPLPNLKIGFLCALSGVAVPMASSVLTLTNPKKFGIIDRNAWQVLHRFGCTNEKPSGQGLTASNYEWYLHFIREIADTLNRTPRAIDLWLYRYFQETSSSANTQIKSAS